MGVPNLPGVPPLAAASYSIASALNLLTSDAPGVYNGAQAAQWGIFLGGSPVVTADTVSSFSYKQEWAVSDYPMEQGAFASYDKVQIPYDIRIRFTAGGSSANKTALLKSIQNIAPGTTIYSAITPEATYSSVTVSHLDYIRTAQNGVGLLQVDVWCINVNVAGGSTLNNTQSSSGADPANGGTVAASDQPTYVGSGGTPGVSADTPGYVGSGPNFTNYIPGETTQAVPGLSNSGF